MLSWRLISRKKQPRCSFLPFNTTDSEKYSTAYTLVHMYDKISLRTRPRDTNCGSREIYALSPICTINISAICQGFWSNKEPLTRCKQVSRQVTVSFSPHSFGGEQWETQINNQNMLKFARFLSEFIGSTLCLKNTGESAEWNLHRLSRVMEVAHITIARTVRHAICIFNATKTHVRYDFVSLFHVHDTKWEHHLEHQSLFTILTVWSCSIHPAGAQKAPRQSCDCRRATDMLP